MWGRGGMGACITWGEAAEGHSACKDQLTSLLATCAYSHIFLPPLLFESAFDLNIQIIRKEASSVFALASVGLVIASLMTGSFMYWQFSGEGTFEHIHLLFKMRTFV